MYILELVNSALKSKTLMLDSQFEASEVHFSFSDYQ